MLDQEDGRKYRLKRLRVLEEFKAMLDGENSNHQEKQVNTTENNSDQVSDWMNERSQAKVSQVQALKEAEIEEVRASKADDSQRQINRW